MSKILVINPNTAIPTAEEMERQLKSIARPDTFVKAIALEETKDFSAYKVFSYIDLVKCTLETVKKAIKYSSDFDGIIIAGFSDVGCDAIKEMLDIPCLGIAETSYHIAALHSHRFSVLTGTDKWTPPKDDYVRALGIQDKIASFRSYSEWNSNDNFEDLKEKLIQIALVCIERDGAEAIVLGGGPLVGFGEILQEEIGVPVIDPTIATFKYMEAILDMGLCHSKFRKWKRPLDSLGDQSGSKPYRRDWLND